MAGVKSLKKIDPGSATPHAIRKMQDNTEQFTEPFKRSAIINGVLLKDLSLTTGVINSISHRLDRKINGWIVVRQRADARIWDSQDTNTIPKRTLNLETSANAVVDLWVF